MSSLTQEPSPAQSGAPAPRLRADDPATMPPARAQDGQWQGLHPQYIAVRLISEVVGYLILLVLTAWPVALKLLGPWSGASWWAVAPLPVAVVILAVIQVLLAPRRVRAYGYREDEQDFLVRKGLLIRSLVTVPYGRMQYVDVGSGPLLRKFGLASITLHTASAETDTELPGITAQEADRLRERLTERGGGDRLIEL